MCFPKGGGPLAVSFEMFLEVVFFCCGGVRIVVVI